MGQLSGSNPAGNIYFDFEMFCPFPHALERTQLVQITVREFLDDILNTNSVQIIVR